MLRTLITQPAVLAADHHRGQGGQPRPAAPSSWLHRTGVILCLLSGVAGVASGWIWLSKAYPTEEAALYFCLATALGALICLGFAHGLRLYKEWRAVRWQKSLMEKVENTADFALNELETFGRDYPKTAAALLALAGYLAASRAAAGMEHLLAALDPSTSNLKGNEDNE